MSAQDKNAKMQATIEQMRKQNSVQKPLQSKSDTANTPAKRNRQRVTASDKKIQIQDRKTAMNTLIRQLLLGEITQGFALKQFRVNVLGLKQDAYAKLVSVSRKTLSDVENDKGNYSIEIINRIFKPFGLQTGLVPVAKNLLTSLLSS